VVNAQMDFNWIFQKEAHLLAWNAKFRTAKNVERVQELIQFAKSVREVTA
jgi:hypothetical protein